MPLRQPRSPRFSKDRELGFEPERKNNAEFPNGKVEFDFLPGCKSDLPMITDRKDREKKERGAPTREIYSPPPDHDQSAIDDDRNNRNACCVGHS